MEIEWDRKKAISNLKKHGIDFADAVAVLEDERAITIFEDYPDEERFITTGMDAFSRILVVVYTWRGNSVRLISAREAGRLDDDILQWFRDQVHEAGGGNYQTLINSALREYKDINGENLRDILRSVVREELARYGKKLSK